MGGIDHLSCNGWIIDPSRQNSCTNSYVVSVIRPSIFSLNHLPYMQPPPPLSGCHSHLTKQALL